MPSRWLWFGYCPFPRADARPLIPGQSWGTNSRAGMESELETMRRLILSLCFGLGLTAAVFALLGSPTVARERPLASPFDSVIQQNSQRMIDEGRQTFRFDTFGSEQFFGDTIKLHQAIAGTANGGVGPGLSPRQALALGLKVDAEALPPDVVAGIQSGQISLDDPATTLALLKLNAVVGVTGFFDNGRTLRSVGVQCALCHATVNNSFSPGVGQRLDGWANRDLDVGAIINLAPDLTAVDTLLGVDDATTRRVLSSWGPGKFDAELFLDGKGFRPDGGTAATLLPPAFGLAGVNLHTWTGAWGTVTYWNAFVANLEMHGSPGTFFDPRLDDATKFPVAARNRLGHITSPNDRITPKLPALHFYQLAIPAPTPPAGSFDAAAAGRGKLVFRGKAQCVSCHVPTIFTEPGWNLHTPAEIGIDDFQANRSPDGRYRTSPLGGLWTHTKGGFYHDGRFATLDAVVESYNTRRALSLTAGEKSDLVQYLLSLPEQTSPVNPTVTPAIPENTPLWLFASGLLAMGWFAYRGPRRSS